MFTATDYHILSSIVFDSEGFPGYRPNVVESPHGNGVYDSDKKYAHISMKYLREYTQDLSQGETGTLNTLKHYLKLAHEKSLEVAVTLGIPRAFWPVLEHGTLRILEYPPGAVTNPHTDFDLFTLMLFRNTPENFKYLIYTGEGEDIRSDGSHDKHIRSINKLSHQTHFGELLELINPDLTATKHEVVEDQFNRTQYSIVYFAIPDHKAILPTGQKVGEWLDERLSRSRKDLT